LYCLFFFDIRLLITPLVSSGHCVVCLSSIYDFWLPLWYLQAFRKAIYNTFINNTFIIEVDSVNILNILGTYWKASRCVF
jgi:hypothetical protein